MYITLLCDAMHCVRGCTITIYFICPVYVLWLLQFEAVIVCDTLKSLGDYCKAGGLVALMHCHWTTGHGFHSCGRRCSTIILSCVKGGSFLTHPIFREFFSDDETLMRVPRRAPEWRRNVVALWKIGMSKEFPTLRTNIAKKPGLTVKCGLY